MLAKSRMSTSLVPSGVATGADVTAETNAVVQFANKAAAFLK